MFFMNSDVQKQIYSSMYELGAYNFRVISELTKKNIETSKEILSVVAGSMQSQKESQDLPTNPFFPTNFNYIPNLYKDRSENSALFNPFEFFQPKKEFSWPAPMTPMQTMEIMKGFNPASLQAQPTFSGMPAFPFFPGKFNSFFPQMFNSGRDQAPSLKGFMMFFDIPLNQANSLQNPMIKFYEMFHKD